MKSKEFGLALGLGYLALATGAYGWENQDCDSVVIAAMESAWQRGGNGYQEYEAGFCLKRKYLNGVLTTVTEDLPYTHEADRIHFRFDPACQAIYHTHPNRSNPDPSEGDRNLADTKNVVIYTMTRNGLRRYVPEKRSSVTLPKGTQVIRPGLDWLKECRSRN